MHGKPPNIRIPDTYIEINDEEIAFNPYLCDDRSLTQGRYLYEEQTITHITSLKWFAGLLALIIIVIFLTVVQQN